MLVLTCVDGEDDEPAILLSSFELTKYLSSIFEFKLLLKFGPNSRIKISLLVNGCFISLDLFVWCRCFAIGEKCVPWMGEFVDISLREFSPMRGQVGNASELTPNCCAGEAFLDFVLARMPRRMLSNKDCFSRFT